MKKNQLTADIADHMPGLVAIYNIQTGQYLYVNKAITKILGYQPEDFINGGVAFVTSLIHPDDVLEVTTTNNMALIEAESRHNDVSIDNIIMNFEYRMKHRDGSWVWLHTTGNIFQRDENGAVEQILNVSINITERKEKEAQLESLKSEFEQLLEQKTEALQDREKMFRSLIEVVEDYAILRLDVEGNIGSWNEGVANILGYSEEEIMGQPISIFFTEEEQRQNVHHEELEQAKTEGTIIRDGIRVRKDGTTFFSTSTITPIWDERGILQGFSKIIRDVTELKEAEEAIRYHALHDTLTGLPNRKSLDEFYSAAQSSAIRQGHKLAIIFLDLDRFKTINDTLGHAVGDLMLKEVAYRLRNSVRKIDTVVRLGGDEFIILVNVINSSRNAARVADKILESLIPITRMQDQSLHITASMGIAMFPADGQDIFTLLKNADTALYRAKAAGRNRYQFYDYSMNIESTSLLALEHDLRTAVQSDQLFMEYQPFTDIPTGKVVGVEALVRWNHPKLGILKPFDFIPLAEETGMIVPMGEWILRTVCEYGQKLKDLNLPLKMTVNLSGRQFAEAELVDNITSILAETGFEPSNLELEITESVAMENIARTGSKLNDLKEQGIAITIDDFGTGYSSLSYLKKFPVQKLKIDKSFVQHAITNPQDATIIQAIISMGHSLGLSVCAEGIEDVDQLALLASMGCNFAQGYLISKPLSYDKLVEWLQDLDE